MTPESIAIVTQVGIPLAALFGGWFIARSTRRATGESKMLDTFAAELKVEKEARAKTDATVVLLLDFVQEMRTAMSDAGLTPPPYPEELKLR